jgi:hypothetical protein
MMLEVVHDNGNRTSPEWFERLLNCDVESKWIHCHIIITVPG